MAIPLQLRRGTTAQHTTFIGTVGEVTVDTDKDTLIVHDGIIAGGYQVARTTKTSTDNAIARFDGTTGAIQNSSVVIDDSGNVGIGVTPSAWQTGWRVLELGNISSIFDTGISTWFGSNVYRNTSGIFTYKSNGYASAIQNTNGQHVFFTTPSGTAGNPITWNTAMTLDASGNLGLGVTPNAWNTAVKAVQVKGTTLWNYNNLYSYFGNNYYFDGTNRVYINNGYAQELSMLSNGSVVLSTAPSGTAGNNATFTTALTIPSTGGIQLPNTAIANATTLDWYEEATATLTATGMTTTPTGTATLTRVGNTVSIEIPTISGTSNATSFIIGTLPTNFRPIGGNRSIIVPVVDNGGATALSLCEINTAGILTIYKTYDGGAFTASGTKSIKRVSSSYLI